MPLFLFANKSPVLYFRGACPNKKFAVKLLKVVSLHHTIFIILMALKMVESGSFIGTVLVKMLRIIPSRAVTVRYLLYSQYKTIKFNPSTL